MNNAEITHRNAIIEQCIWMNANGLNQGTSGNISVRHGEHMLISPSATPYESTQPEMIAKMELAGEYGVWDGPLKPSTEWRFHLDILNARPEIGANFCAHP